MKKANRNHIDQTTKIRNAIMKKLLTLLAVALCALSANAQMNTFGGIGLRVNDTTTYQANAAAYHTAGYYDIYFNNQATNDHWDVWNGSSYDHIFAFGQGGDVTITPVVNTFTADHTLALTDVNDASLGQVRMNLTGTANNVTVPPNASVAFAIGAEISVVQQGTGVTTVVQGSGVTITPPVGGNLVSPGQGQAMVLKKTGTNTWDLYNGNAPSSITKTDDSNVTLTLGGSPTVAALAPVSLTLGWTGVLTVARGGTGTATPSGTFTPTLTNVTNVAASTAYVTGWFRVGDMVTVFGKIDIDATLSASTATELGVSLPVASNLAAEQDLGGNAISDAIASLSARIKGDAANDRASIVFKSLSLNNDSYSFEFSYQIK